jgi:hypothetical protein
MIIQKMSLISSAEDESSISVADHYKGTPPLKSKKKKRMSHEVPSDFQVFISLKISLKMLPSFQLVRTHFGPILISFFPLQYVQILLLL